MHQDKYPPGVVRNFDIKRLQLTDSDASRRVKMSSDFTSNQIHDGLFQIGLRNRREVVGNAYVDTAFQNGSSEFAYPGQQLVTEYVSFV